MTWECAECKKKESDETKISTICHHCGKLLCDSDRIGILDDAFADAKGLFNNMAYHCAACKRTYHSNQIIKIK